jgi:hypothetical protein
VVFGGVGFLVLVLGVSMSATAMRLKENYTEQWMSPSYHEDRIARHGDKTKAGLHFSSYEGLCQEGA